MHVTTVVSESNSRENDATGRNAMVARWREKDCKLQEKEGFEV